MSFLFSRRLYIFYLPTYVFGLSLKCRLSERRWNPSRETTMKDLRWLSQSYICSYTTAFAEISVYFSFFSTNVTILFMLFQGLSDIRHEILDMCNLCFVFVVAGFQEKFGFVGEEEGLQTPSRVRFDIQSAFFKYKNYIKKHLILPILVFPSDYHKKQNTLAALRKKALDKNPDEFYFNMISSQLQVRSLKRSLAKHPTKTPKDTNWNSLLLSIDAYWCHNDRMEFT